jgi:ankyrin repeat protein
MQQLDVVYSSTQQPLPRRCRAAFEHAVASLSFDITQDPGDENDAMITRALTMLGFAATNGHETARRMFGWLQATLRPGAALATAIEDGQELEWLASGMTAGSRICARRLRQLNPGRHRATLRVLRRDYGGIGSKCWHLPPLGPDFSKAEAYQLWYHSTTGHETELRRTCAVSREAVNATFEGEASLPAACRENVNATFKGETPLIAACRSGHGKIARSLLEAGASAAQLDDCGRGPLHYLSSLDAEDMQDIAARLMAAGASLEAWSWYTTDLWCGGFDSLYGHANGTPLFWAVQADCRPAVEVLLGLGAQVFPQSAGRPTSIDKERHYSPVHWAARMHQSEILGLLLGHAEANSSTTGGKGVAEALNTAWEACQERLTRVLPVNLAATYGGGDVFSRILLHGASHIEQCFKTVHLLLDAGTSIERLGEADHRLALKMAAELGPPYALRALRTWRDGAFRPDMDEWGTAVCMACAHDDRSTFDELRAMDVAVPKGPLGWPSMLAQVALVTNQTYYVHAIMEMHEALDPAPADYSAAFDAAWSRGHDRVAAAILERAGRCDVDTLTPLPRKEYVYVMADEQEGSPPAPANSSGGALSAIWSRGHEKIPADVLESITRSIGHSNVKTLTAVSPVQEYRSILGSLISEATSHPGHVKTIDLFLRMVGARDSVFHAVFKREGDPSPTVYNALEYALSYRPHLNCESPVVQILEVLTKYFQHPHKHLNAPSVAGNQSLLHLAVQTGDWRAACFLLQLGGVDLRARNADGWVAFDWCLLRWEDSSRDESPVHSGVLARVSKEKAQEHWETDTRELMRVMKGGGASKFGSISLVVKRLSAEELLIIGIDEEGEYGICTALEQGKQSHLIWYRNALDLTARLDIRCPFPDPSPATQPTPTNCQGPWRGAEPAPSPPRVTGRRATDQGIRVSLGGFPEMPFAAQSLRQGERCCRHMVVNS